MPTFRVKPHFLIGALPFFLLCSMASAAETKQPKTRASDICLKCRIAPGMEGNDRTVWLLELRDATGKPLRKVLGLAGSIVRFKNLLPGIYRLYVSAPGRTRSSQSIDLTPDPEKSILEFTKEISPPRHLSGSPDRYEVNTRVLAIPQAASQAMLRSEKSQLAGNLKQAMENLRHAIELYPDYAEAWNNLGACYRLQGDQKQAFECFSKATHLEPAFQAGWINLGGSLLSLGRYREAVDANEKAVDLCPEDAVAHSQLGLSYYYLFDFPQARRYFQRAIELDPAIAGSPHKFLSQIAMAENSYAEAVRYLRDYLEIHPNASDAHQVKQKIQHISAIDSAKQ